MRISDLCPAYLSDILEKGDRAGYENRYPELFAHYYEFYGNRERPLTSISPEDLESNSRIVRDELRNLMEPFGSRGFDIDELEFILFVGQGSTNGHAIEIDNKFSVWLPVETYNTRQLASVFIAHEIIHCLHYTLVPRFYFKTRVESYIPGRLLITEGLATYLTARILGLDDGAALWADFLPIDKLSSWLDACSANEKAIRKILRDNFDGGGEGTSLFHAADPDDILRFRSGYYIGMKIIGEIAVQRRLGIDDLLRIPKEEYLKLAFDLLG